MAPVADVGRVAGFADGLGLPEWPRLPSGARAGLDGPVLGFGVAHDHCAHLVLVGSCHVAVSRAVTGGSVRLFDLGHSGLAWAGTGAVRRARGWLPGPPPGGRAPKTPVARAGRGAGFSARTRPATRPPPPPPPAAGPPPLF